LSQRFQLKPVFVKTKNVRNFEAVMDGLMLNEGEGCLGMVWGKAGLGKSRTAVWYAAQNGCVYLPVDAIWRGSEGAFLQALCRELGVIDPPRYRVKAYYTALGKLIESPRPVLVDEFEKLPMGFLDIVRDLSDRSTAPFVLIGEEGLVRYMERDRRIWSRTFQALEFEAIGIPDVIMFAKEAAGLELSVDVASVLHRESGGFFRLIKRYVLALYHAAQAGDKEITVEMVMVIIQSSLKGRTWKGKRK
jgi:DNA transposition AAA+ family ATPase